MDAIGVLQAYDPDSLSKLVYKAFSSPSTYTTYAIPKSKFIIVFNPEIMSFISTNIGICGISSTIVAPGGEATSNSGKINIRVEFATSINVRIYASNITALTIAYCPI